MEHNKTLLRYCILLMLILNVQSMDEYDNYDDSTEDTLSYVDYNDSQGADCQYHESTYQNNTAFYRGINDCSICLCQNRKVSCDDVGCQKFMVNQINSSNEFEFLESVEYNYEEEQEVEVANLIQLSNDFPGSYCASRYPKSNNGTCCDDRLDSCSVQIDCKSLVFK